MFKIRQAEEKDSSRIAEIIIFNNRVNFFPIFKSEEYSFGELQVTNFIKNNLGDNELKKYYVYEEKDIVKGLIMINGTEVERLYVDVFFQGRGIGEKLFRFAIEKFDVNYLWALEKNTRAIKFYNRFGFCVTDDKKFEEGTTEYLVMLKREKTK